MTDKKYELTEKTIQVDYSVLHRIRAVRNFTLSDGTEVKVGDLGGFSGDLPTVYEYPYDSYKMV